MRPAGIRPSHDQLDQVYSAAQLEAFDAGAFLQALAGELAELSAAEVDTAIRAALAAVDAFASRAMRARLDRDLHDDTSVPQQFRTYLAAQILDYAGEIDRLRARAEPIIARTNPDGAADTVGLITGAAEHVFALHGRLRQGIVDMVPKPADPEPEPQPAREPDFFDNLELD